ncbi:MAG: type I secretion protein TolC [Zetaproteobacteria bacterium]|nr:MAG: type I secretion protein TolC [Zetaproteobacteria bacterium]
MKRMRFVALVLLSPSLAWGNGLQDAVGQALAHAPALQAAAAARDAAAEDRVLGRAWLLPYVVAQVAVTRKQERYRYDRPISLLATRVRNNEQAYSVMAYQPLFDLEKWATYRQGAIAAASGELKLALARQQTVLSAAGAWLEVWRAQAALAAAQASERALARLAARAQAAFDAGTAAVNEALDADSRRDLARAQRIRAEQMLATAHARLQSLLGAPANVPARIPEMIAPISVHPDKVSAWEARAARDALSVRLRGKAVELADAGHLRAVGGALPKVQLVAGLSRDVSSDGTFGGVRVNAASVGIEVSMPLYAGGGTWAQQRKSRKEQLRAEFELTDAQRAARLLARQSFLELRTTAAEVRALRKALHSAATARRAAHAGFAVGLRAITEVLDAEERLALSRQRYADAVARHAMAYLRLMASVNALDDAALARVDALLEASAD